MSYGILLLRLVLGLTLAAHGAQKLFGAFGGHGLRGTGGFFSTLGLRAPLLTALGVGLSEFGGGLLLAGGLLMPFAALAVAVVMLSAIALVHRPNGFWNTNGGYEFNLLIWAAAVALAATGGGRFSLDAFAGWADNVSGLWWGLGVLWASLLVSAAAVTAGRGDGRPGEVTDLAGDREAVRRAA
jgi:putative oxidoreductase